jgi:hypothetical protein
MPGSVLFCFRTIPECLLELLLPRSEPCLYGVRVQILATIPSMIRSDGVRFMIRSDGVTPSDS